PATLLQAAGHVRDVTPRGLRLLAEAALRPVQPALGLVDLPLPSGQLDLGQTALLGQLLLGRAPQPVGLGLGLLAPEPGLLRQPSALLLELLALAGELLGGRVLDVLEILAENEHRRVVLGVMPLVAVVALLGHRSPPRSRSLPGPSVIGSPS